MKVVSSSGKNKAPLVSDYLKAVDYKSLENFKPSEFALRYIMFVNLISKGMEMDSSPPVHYKMIDTIIGRKRYLANLCTRGLGKTTLFAETLILFLAVFPDFPGLGKVTGIIYVADSMDNGAKNLRKNIETRYNSSDFLKSLLPKVKFTDTMLEFENHLGHKLGVKLFGAKTGIRGTKIYGGRPTLSILDDLISDDDAKSVSLLKKIEDTVYKAVFPALHPKRRKVIWCGTPHTKADPLYKAVESGAWDVNVYPVCERFPCSKEEFKGAWESRFNYEDVLDLYNTYLSSGKIKDFRQEMMLSIASEEDRIVPDDHLRWCTATEIINNKHNYNFYITTDFATSTSRKADFTVIGVWAVDAEENRYLIDGRIGRQVITDNFDQLFELVKKYNPISVGIEVNGVQNAFISLLYKEMNNRNLSFTIARGKQNSRKAVGIASSTNKMSRFSLTLPFFERGKIFLPSHMRGTTFLNEIIEELEFATIDGLKSEHDDAIDMISQFDQMYIIYPSNDIEYNKPDNAYDADGNYLFEETRNISTAPASCQDYLA